MRVFHCILCLGGSRSREKHLQTFCFNITTCAFYITVYFVFFSPILCHAFLRYDLLNAFTCERMCPYLHLSYSHAILREHSQRRVGPPGPHHVHRQAAVIELLFGLQERVSVEPDVSLRRRQNEPLKTKAFDGVFVQQQAIANKDSAVQLQSSEIRN